jgi:hypothetical protein
MSTAYPVSLPCVSRVEGHNAALDAGLVRTPMGAGNSRQRRNYRNLPHMISLVFMVPQDSWRYWLSWVNANAYDDWLTLNLPGLKAGAAQKDTTPTLVRFCTDIQADLVPVHRLWLWRARVSCEYLPDVDDFQEIGFWYIGGTPAKPSTTWVIGGTPDGPAPDMTNPGTVDFPTVVV